MPHRAHRSAIWAVSALILCSGFAPAGPADPLLRIVPQDSAFCVVVQNLRDRARTVGASPFAEWFAESPLGTHFRNGPEAQKLREAARHFQDTLGVSETELLDEVFGDAIVFAYKAGPTGRPDDETGLILVRPRKPEVLARLLDRLNAAQTKNGEVRAVREASHRGRTYTVRDEVKEGLEHYFLHGGVFAFSGQEQALKDAIDRDLSAPPVEEQTPAIAESLRRLGVHERAAVLWLNPRSWDAEMAKSAAEAADPSEAAFVAQFAKLWGAIDGAAVSLEPDRGLVLELTVAVARERMPAELAGTVRLPSDSNTLWSVVPQNAIAAVGGQLRLSELRRAVESFAPADGKRSIQASVEEGLGPVFGKDKLPVVIRGIGPEWIAWVAPPAGGEWVPRGAVAVRLAEGETTRAVTQALDLGMQLAKVGYNRTHADQIEFGERKQAGVTVKYLANDNAFPAGWQPCYAVKVGFLVISSSPAVATEFEPNAGARQPAQLLRVSARHLRGYLAAHKSAIAKAAAGYGHQSPTEVESGIDKLAVALEAFDRIEVRHETEGDLVKLSVHVEMIKPLK